MLLGVPFVAYVDDPGPDPPTAAVGARLARLAAGGRGAGLGRGRGQVPGWAGLALIRLAFGLGCRALDAALP